MSSSSEILSDKAMDIDGVANKDFAKKLALWNFQEKGILRYREISVKNSAGETLQNYRISTPLFFEVILEEWDGLEGKWIPFYADDVQVEFVMIDPFIRTKLVPIGKDGKYGVEILIPDVYGVFKFVVDYRRKGYSLLTFQHIVTVRPTRTDEFERFIFAANPYYIAVFSVMCAFFVFVVVFLFLKKESFTAVKTKTD